MDGVELGKQWSKDAVRMLPVKTRWEMLSACIMVGTEGGVSVRGSSEGDHRTGKQSNSGSEREEL